MRCCLGSLNTPRCAPLAVLPCWIIFAWITIHADAPTYADELTDAKEHEAASVNFEKSVAAVLIKNCVTCHNPGEAKGGLDLTRKETLFKGGDSGPVIVAGKPAESLLIERIGEGSMPPPKSGNRLPPAEVAALTEWVKAGVPWPAERVLSTFEFTTERRAGLDWWSLQPVVRPPVPQVAGSSWVRNPIDAFIGEVLERRGIQPAPAADKGAYLRRVKYDLVGLPPTPEELESFLADQAADAEEKLVDRLLASPHYGERWGRHWLDVVRFGESDGFENDKLRENSWHYRDYVIRSFNADLPYPQFIREQLAGDVLQPVTRDGIIATGFLVAGPWDEVQSVGRSKLEKMRTHEEQLEELIGAVSQTFLGMTVNCARCHDHKFDPIPQSDYYRFKAVFDGTDHGNRPLLTPLEQQQRELSAQPLRTRIQELKLALEDFQNIGPANATAQGADLGKLLVAGKFGQGLDGRAGQAEAKSKPSFHTPPLTVECWAKVDGKQQFNILAANNPKESKDHWELYTYTQSGVFSAYFPGYSPSEIKSTVDLADGKWHYLAMRFDGSRVQLYVDAKLVTDVAVSRDAARVATPVGSLFFAAYPPHQIRCDGVVDELRISHALRTIESVPQSPFTADAETSGLWHFDELVEQRIADSSKTPSATKTEEVERQAQLSAELKQKEQELATLAAPLVYSGLRLQPGPTHVYLRGEIEKPGPQVTPGGLSPVRSTSAELGLAADAPEGDRRRRLAEWITDINHPLTARVLVNRLWQYHFGQGLIETPNDFGFNGGRPTHPELLDWLAAEFANPTSATGESAAAWSIKRLHKLIVLSATYRQSAQFNPQAADFDADNRLLWRFPPHRLEAEIARDAMLAVSGELNPQVGGPSFRPFTVTVFLTHFYHLIDPDAPEFNRRTVYRINVNTGKSPLLDALDCPAPSITTPKRRNTTTALQALALMNDSFVLRQAERFAKRVENSSPDQAARVTLAYHLALGRSPKPDELGLMSALAEREGLASVCWVLLNSSEFLFVR